MFEQNQGVTINGVSRRAIIILIFLFAVMPAPGCMEQEEMWDNPAWVARHHEELVRAGRYDEAWDMFSAAYKTQVRTADDLAAMVDSGEIVVLYEFQVRDTNWFGDMRAEVDWRADRIFEGETMKLGGYTEMVLEEGEWKINTKLATPVADTPLG